MPGPVIKKPGLPNWADPETASVFDPLYETLIKKAVGALGIDDPTTAITSMASPMGLMAAIKKGAAPKLEPFVVEMYKRRLQADPALAYHPGVQQLPEFQEAFKALYPHKKILGPGVEQPVPFSKTMNAYPIPPAVTAEIADPLEAVAGRVAVTPVKQPRTVTIREMRVSKGLPAQGNIGGGKVRPTKYSEKFRRTILAKYDTWTGTKKELAEEFGIPESTLGEILNRSRR